MLVDLRKIALAASLLVLVFTAGCYHTVPVIRKVELNQTPELKLTVRNAATEWIKILPALDQTGSTPIELAPEELAKISFRLFTIADLEETRYSWMRMIQGSETHIIESADPVRFIDIQGEDGLILVRGAQDQLWQFLLDLDSCMELPNVIEELPISGPPEAGIPVDLCE